MTAKTKSQLADKYNVDTRTFVNWIKKNVPLGKELKKLGYHDRDKTFTPKQIEVIYQYIGDPS